ncbi:hypothetical protein [Sphingomonas desiccabilis]|uniref:Uncharacterized protein n=1 Tax=Sphingomonas desiccabilis TaxID=429134 RepID=A0A4Q2IWM2_9SPHN|nr:hypothetical protein [Sphingomonas desiccabilis]MBB3910167.1 hypothetical protein [Sphingomonas desiccabilis]RXZ34846.1 hypothetical protein EO081_04080 [Sphingomonas desiccabilis]
MTTTSRFVGLDEDFVLDTVDADLQVTGTIVTEQHIPQSFLDRVAAKRNWQDAQSFSALTKGDDIEKIHLARIPVAVVNKWSREGFDLFQALHDPNGAALILAKLRSEDLTAFQTTSRTF